jgi:hypothetical protein
MFPLTQQILLMHGVRSIPESVFDGKIRLSFFWRQKMINDKTAFIFTYC